MSALPGLEVRRFTAAEVLHMVRCGILDDDEKVELIDGALVVKEPHGPGHSDISALVAERLREAGVPGTYARLHSPIAAGDDSLPEPDVALCRGPVGRYVDAYPGGEDVVLVVEVAVTSLARDVRKGAIHARAGVPEYWLLDVAAGRLHVHQDPRSDGTRARTSIVERGSSVRVPGAESDLAVSALLG